MDYVLLPVGLVEDIHDAVTPGELSGRSRDKSLTGAFARVENRWPMG